MKLIKAATIWKKTWFNYEFQEPGSRPRLLSTYKYLEYIEPEPLKNKHGEPEFTNRKISSPKRFSIWSLGEMKEKTNYNLGFKTHNKLKLPNCF